MAGIVGETKGREVRKAAIWFIGENRAKGFVKHFCNVIIRNRVGIISTVCYHIDRVRVDVFPKLMGICAKHIG